MSVAVEIFGFFMAALGLLMLGVTLPHSYWRVSTVHGSVITTNTIFENLWFSCATDSLGVYSCREFPSLLALSGYLQACRALMITAIFLGFLGLFLGMVGLRCINIGSLELSRKAKLAATAGALHILAGNRGKESPALSWGVESGANGAGFPVTSSSHSYPIALPAHPSFTPHINHQQCFLSPHWEAGMSEV
ncbi:claudin-15 isoform X3 [Suricata suricatta]|uniref:claudin-15 isoform X3 n=1 Tax=Suricata suricatta TaxID=37032 RepID=UPI001155746E|nr:claudin-15 isoform X3 [Suricata suricatta]XP_029803301.1 claudin-15 isoform X3 [Suricata suricatta]